MSQGLVLGLLCAACAREPLVAVEHWEFDPGDGHPRDLLLPTHVTSFLPNRPVRYRLRAEVALPPELRNRPLTLTIPNLMARVSLRVAHHDVPELGAPAWSGYRDEAQHRWRFTHHGDQLSLDLFVDHEWPLSAWIDCVPRISATSGGDAEFRFLSLFNYWTALGGATSALIGFLYLCIFLLDRRRVAHAWFGVGGIAGSYYSLFWVGVTQPVLGHLESAGIIITLSLALLSAVYFLHATFDVGKVPWPLTVAAAALVLSAALLRDRFVCIRVLARPMVIFSMAVVVHHMIVLGRLKRRAKPPMNVNLVLACWLIVGVAAVPDFVSWSGYGQHLGGLHTGSLGILIYVILQCIALSREHIAHLQEIERLYEDLKDEKVRHVEEFSRLATSIAAGQSRKTEPRDGDIVAGKYRLTKRIGEGGMGVVFEVEAFADGKALALKLLTTRPSAMAIARFSREAALLATLDHPNVVGFVDFGITGEGDPFLAMELVKGPSLARERARYRDVPWAMFVIEQIARGLEEIHASGMVHRDLKPGNVLLEYTKVDRPVAKIADLGISYLWREMQARPDRVVGNDSAETKTAPRSRAVGSAVLTQVGDVLGTPRYMAPEVREMGASAATPASDMYSFGLIAYEILSGDCPENGYPSSAMSSPEIANAITSLIERCIAADPAVRPTAAEIRAQLDSESDAIMGKARKAR